MPGKLTRREMIILAGSSTAQLATVAVATKALQVSIDLNASSEKAQELKRLARACHRRAQVNERYRPAYEEVFDWVWAIYSFDRVLKDPLHYCAMIDHESLWNPTHYKLSDGNTRGLGSMAVDTARDLVEKEGLKVQAAGTALFNPRFAIKMMIRYYEQIYLATPIRDRERWALYGYNGGPGAARRRSEKGKKLSLTYHKTHKRRRALIVGEMKGAEA